MQSRKVLAGSLLASSTILSSFVAEASDDFALIQEGFLSGEEFLALSSNAKVYYVTGAVDGMLLAPFFFGAPDSDRWLVQCVKGKSNSQLSAVLEKFLKDNPERWHDSVHVSFIVSLHATCPGRK